MLLFCPCCANILTVSAHPETGRNRLECRTCPYEYAIATPLFSRREFVRKEKEDVFGGPGAWDNAQKTKVQCPADGCDGGEAAFFQVQIRSADEPMTSFFKVLFGSQVLQIVGVGETGNKLALNLETRLQDISGGAVSGRRQRGRLVVAESRSHRRRRDIVVWIVGVLGDLWLGLRAMLSCAGMKELWQLTRRGAQNWPIIVTHSLSLLHSVLLLRGAVAGKVHAQPQNKQQARQQRRRRRPKHHPVGACPLRHIGPGGPPAQGLRAAVGVGGVAQQHAHTQPAPEAGVVWIQAQDDGFDKGKVEPATAELGVEKGGGVALVGRVGDGVAGHGREVAVRVAEDEECAIEGEEGLEGVQHEPVQPVDRRCASGGGGSLRTGHCW
ncbi:uncharacterized protein SPSK_08768 [Sporothrix schenckii 1099-18]|uniref:TFIIS-type domain-containing protein n=1 Tax=Sporothrix schenckii 1099-18 TaxID=1397361 RepID=A0A0F2MAQ6_SPOSC|nr:uncharacterized protein SPSK_08768 [Sporothrix schenckii 1099-18]KJR85246.1 hypothetical protein SPSK_08768 [Sporothrix schenckii 1099-18]